MRTSSDQEDRPAESSSQSDECHRSKALTCYEGREQHYDHWSSANGNEGRDTHASRGNGCNVTELGERYHTSHKHHRAKVTSLDVKEAAAQGNPTGEKKQRSRNSQAQER